MEAAQGGLKGDHTRTGVSRSVNRLARHPRRQKTPYRWDQLRMDTDLSDHVVHGTRLTSDHLLVQMDLDVIHALKLMDFKFGHVGGYLRPLPKTGLLGWTATANARMNLRRSLHTHPAKLAEDIDIHAL